MERKASRDHGVFKFIYHMNKIGQNMQLKYKYETWSINIFEEQQKGTQKTSRNINKLKRILIIF